MAKYVDVNVNQKKYRQQSMRGFVEALKYGKQNEKNV